MKNRYLQRFSLFHVLSREEQEVALLHGRIDGEKVAALLGSVIPANDIDEVYLCGPQPMAEAIRVALLEHGVAPAHIHLELFGTPAVAPRRELSPEEAARQSTVVFQLDGKRSTLRLNRGAESILDAALKVRRDLPFACKGGMCCTCKARLLEGEVEMDLNYGLEPAEVEAGYVLTCQSHPLSERVVLDYDQR